MLNNMHQHTLSHALITQPPVKHMVLDLSIKNMGERHARAIVLDNAVQVAAHIGVTVNAVFTNREPGKKLHSNFYKKYYAVRLIN